MRVLVMSGSTARLPDPVYPLGAAIVGTIARRSGHEVSWFDALSHEDPQKTLAEKIESIDPDMLCLSIRNIDSCAFPSNEVYFEDHLSLVDICRRNSSAPIVLGGSGFSIMPEAFLNELKADCGVVGGGESTVRSVFDLLANGRECPRIVSADSGETAFIAPDRDLFDADWYYLHGGMANIQTKRGCPFDCVYCTYPLLEGRDIRTAEPGAVVDEMESISRLGICHFFFVDAVFNRPESHAAAICEEIIRRKLDISFTGYFVPKGDLKELPTLLKRAGCTAVEFGTDALSDPVLAALGKGFTVDEAIAYSLRIAEVGIPQCHNLILGSPGETEKTIEESLARLDEIDPRAVIVSIGLRVYPGTRLATMGRNKDDGQLLDSRNLEPVFFIEEHMANIIIENAAAWINARRGWICPGLGIRCNPKFLTRQREVRKHKGVLWTLF
ncbi:MAG: radical SAM protein [Proteobacteria bacterium]|nr:radical SAM protein [Pseudomonadota bacterium]